jgi:hypothetical protein
MQIKELVSFYINESSEILEVTFRLESDKDDEIRTTQIEISETETFGYDFLNKSSESYNRLFGEEYESDSEELFEKDDELEVDEIEIISFLNEYYLIYPDKLPTAELF